MSCGLPTTLCGLNEIEKRSIDIGKLNGGCMISGTEIYNYSMIRDKLFNNLVSIIDGILSDGKVNDIEIVYLATWLREAEEIS
ncbi:hypothetical protein [Tatumella ptyseos]